jgi:hypothetical protein
MKNQYFGDVNDYRKYGLLRILQSRGEYKLLVVWMLTGDDRRSDGEIRGYLKEAQRNRWERFDPELYGWLRKNVPETRSDRGVGMMERFGMVPRTSFFRAKCPMKSSVANVGLKT